MIAEISDPTMRVLKGCGVEMLIIDEADRFKSKTFAEVRDIFEKLEIPVMAAIRALNKGLSRIDLETLKLGFGERSIVNPVPIVEPDLISLLCSLRDSGSLNNSMSIKYIHISKPVTRARRMTSNH